MPTHSSPEREYATCWSQAHWCVQSRYYDEYAQRVGARGEAVGKSLSLGVSTSILDLDRVAVLHAHELA